jgi:YD repeat-containing protein
MAKNHASRTVAVKLSPLASILPALLLTLMFVSAWAHAAEIDYVYDDLGRLRAVIDPSSDTAVYNYDAVGNLLSIFRQSSSVVSIIDFSPKAGPVGTNVTIYGTGFSATPSQNSVTFNGLAATVTTATTTKIVTSVPSGATTGLIGVTAPGGSASSTQVFTVTESTGAPTITGFSPTIGTPGTAVNITGTNFESTPSRNNLFFNVTNAQIASSSPAAISATAPAGTSGRLTVATRFGTAVSTGDFFIPPSPYTPASVELTGRMVLGESRTISISTANKIGLILFDGVQGQRVSVNFSNVTISSTTVRIYNPDGTISATGTVPTVGETIDSAALPVTGTYTILIDPDSTYTGNMTLSLHDVLTTAVPITPNGPGVNVNIATPGQEAVFSFSGTAGQKMSALLSDLTVNGCPSPANFAMYAPNGSKLGGGSPCWATSYFIEPQILPVTGTYTLVVDGIGSATFQGTVNLYQVVDITGNITPNAPSTNVNLATPGQRAIFSFSGTAGQKMSALLSNLTVNGCASPVDFSMHAPSGTKLAGGSPCWATSYLIQPQTLPVTGTYSLVVDGIGSATFQATVKVYEVLNLTLAYNGKIRDRVGQGDTALSPDGSLDGTFTASLPAGSGNRTVTLLDLKNNNGGEWDTVPNGFWVLGAANGFDTALFNSSNAAVNFSVADGGSFVLFGSDYANSHFNSGRVFTLTVNFADGAVGTGNVTVP